VLFSPFTMLLVLSILALGAFSDYTPCFTNQWLQDNNVPFRDGDPHDAPPIKLGLPIWMSGQATANMVHILIKEVVGYEIDLVGSATYASGGLLFDTIAGNLDLVVEIWDILNPEDIQDALFTNGDITGYNTLGYVSGDGLFVPDYCMNTTYWANQGIDKPSIFTSLLDPAYVDFYSEQGTFDVETWIMNATNLTEPALKFHIPELCAVQECIPWIMLDQLYMYNRYQSLVRNHNLPVIILTWDYMDTVFTVIPALIAAQKPFMTMSFFPDTFQLQYNLQSRIYFPQATASCYTEQNSTTVDGYGSYDCGFAETKNWKLGSKLFDENEKYMDLTTNSFLNKATFLQDEITSILQEIVTNGSTPHDASCNWLQANVDTWKDWITITPDPVVAHEVNVEAITGYTVGGCIVAGIIGYYLYTSYGLTEEDKVRINVCFSIMGDVLTVLMDIADYFTDFYNVSANLIPLADETNKAIIYFAVAILIIAGFVLVFSIYLHAQDAIRMCLGSGQKSEEYKMKRKETIQKLKIQIQAVRKQSLGNSPEELAIDPALQASEVADSAGLIDDIESQQLIIKSVMKNIYVHLVTMVTEDIPMFAISCFFFFTKQDQVEDINALTISMFFSCMSIGYKVGGAGMLSELQELDKILMKTMPEEEVEGKKLDDEFDDPAQIYDDDE